VTGYSMVHSDAVPSTQSGMSGPPLSVVSLNCDAAGSQSLAASSETNKQAEAANPALAPSSLPPASCNNGASGQQPVRPTAATQPSHNTWQAGPSAASMPRFQQPMSSRPPVSSNSGPAQQLGPAPLLPHQARPAIFSSLPNPNGTLCARNVAATGLALTVPPNEADLVFAGNLARANTFKSCYRQVTSRGTLPVDTLARHRSATVPDLSRPGRVPDALLSLLRQPGYGGGTFPLMVTWEQRRVGTGAPNSAGRLVVVDVSAAGVRRSVSMPRAAEKGVVMITNRE
jgi:hypothetical protein